MQVIQAIDPTETTGKAKNLLDSVKAKFGTVPNMMKTMVNAPAVLEGYLNFSSALNTGTLPAKVREQIALTVADANNCEYCLSAHTAIGKMVGLSQQEITSSRHAVADNLKTDAILKLAHLIVNNRGEVGEKEIEKARQVGVSSEEITEIVANVALNIFTNYFNHIAQTEIDFPKVSLSAKA